MAANAPIFFSAGGKGTVIAVRFSFRVHYVGVELFSWLGGASVVETGLHFFIPGKAQLSDVRMMDCHWLSPQFHTGKEV